MTVFKEKCTSCHATEDLMRCYRDIRVGIQSFIEKSAYE